MAVVLWSAVSVRGVIIGPYTPDDATLHLWHMDESGAPVLDAAANGLDLSSLESGATLGTESYAGAGHFGTALCTYIGNPAVSPGSAGQAAALAALPLQNGMGDNVAMSYAGPSGSFTYEAVVRIDFDPGVNYGADGWGQGHSVFMQIICADADEATNRLFQFRLSPTGTLNNNTQPLLEFINLNRNAEIQSLTASIPTEGADAILAGNWYHVAVSYDGQPDRADNLRFYWTLLSSNRTAANLIGSGRMARSLPAGCQPDFAIGQTGRQSPATPKPNNNFVGLIDEVRMSGSARSADGMMFGGPTSIAKLAVPSERKPTQKTSAVESQPKLVTNAPPVSDAVASANRVESSNPSIVAEGAVDRGPTDKRQIAIMFNCSDSNAGTKPMLDALNSRNAKASFFVTKRFLTKAANASLAQSLFKQGHYVGPQSGGWNGFVPNGTSQPSESCPEMEGHLKQLEALGIERKGMRFFLPTVDQVNSAFARRGRDIGLIMVGGTPGTLSFAMATTEGAAGFASSKDILDSIFTFEHQDAHGLNGFLLLFQLDSGTRRADQFGPHFGEMLDHLRDHGYDFVRVDELLKMSTRPGEAPLKAAQLSSNNP